LEKGNEIFLPENKNKNENTTAKDHDFYVESTNCKFPANSEKGELVILFQMSWKI
jgi:hypothetical protein